MLSQTLTFIYSLVSQVFGIVLPWGLAFGSVVVGLFGLPYLAKAIKKLF